MTAVNPTFAEWLQADDLPSRAIDATLAARWGDSAVESTITSALALKSGADAESARQQAFLGYPLVEDVHTVVGEHRDKLGQVVTITCPYLGYGSGVDVFVVGVKEDRAANLTTLTVLRRLP